MTLKLPIRRSHLWAWILAAAVILPLLSGCLEQLQTTRVAGGTLLDFYLHLYAGELDDARAYFAPGLVTPSAALDQQLKESSIRLRRYEIQPSSPRTDKLNDGSTRVALPGKIRLRAAVGQSTPAPDQGWENTDIMTATVIERGPGWRILDFDLTCCP